MRNKNLEFNTYINALSTMFCFAMKYPFYAPGLKGLPGASSNWIVRLSVRLSVIPSCLQNVQTKCNI